jgi:hypothetical protein
MITVIPKIISLQQCEQIIKDIDAKTNAQSMKYFDVKLNLGIKKIDCKENPIVKLITEKLASQYKIDDIKLLYYPTGSYNSNHSDNSVIKDNEIIRFKNWTHSAIVFLNENFTGGELIYENQGCFFKPTVGTMIITPAGPDYLHYVNKVEYGERYTLVYRLIDINNNNKE